MTWVESIAGGEVARRPLEYESDVLGAVDWAQFNAGTLLGAWAPAPLKTSTDAAPDGLDPHWIRLRETGELTPETLDRARLTRALIDIAPNPWWVWPWIGTALKPLVDKGFDDMTLAGSSASMIEALRTNAMLERDRLAEARFLELVAEGRIEFALRADAQDFELPTAMEFEYEGRAEPLTRDDARVVEKSLLEPLIRNGLNDFESGFACYLDDKSAIEWWHRNVARRHYGLQGWKRDKVFPDFVFAVIDAPVDAPQGMRRVVVMETKGAHLEGNEDTTYKRALLERLSSLYADRRQRRAGELELTGADGNTTVVCDLLVDTAWQGKLAMRYFAAPATA